MRCLKGKESEREKKEKFCFALHAAFLHRGERGDFRLVGG